MPAGAAAPAQPVRRRPRSRHRLRPRADRPWQKKLDDNTVRNKSDRSRYSEPRAGGLAAIDSFCPCDKVREGD